MSSARVFKGFRTMMAAAKSSSASVAAVTNKPKAKPAASPAPKAPKLNRTRPTGILKPVPISSALGNFLGAQETSRADAIKKIWEHIKLHGLQSPSNKKIIRCDKKLKTIFAGKDEVGFLEIAKLLSPHFVKSA